MQMHSHKLISQEAIIALTEQSSVDAALLPGPDNKKQLMRVRSKDGQIDAFLAMVNKPEPRAFSTIDSAWKLTRKLGIKNFVIDNDKFAGEDAA